MSAQIDRFSWEIAVAISECNSLSSRIIAAALFRESSHSLALSRYSLFRSPSLGLALCSHLQIMLCWTRLFSNILWSQFVYFRLNRKSARLHTPCVKTTTTTNNAGQHNTTGQWNRKELEPTQFTYLIEQFEGGGWSSECGRGTAALTTTKLCLNTLHCN